MPYEFEKVGGNNSIFVRIPGYLDYSDDYNQFFDAIATKKILIQPNSASSGGQIITNIQFESAGDPKQGFSINGEKINFMETEKYTGRQQVELVANYFSLR